MSDKDKMQPVNETEAVKKTEITENEVNGEPAEYDRTLCSVCQKHPREEGSYYCSECRTKMMKTKIKGRSIFAAVMCVLVSLVAMLLLGANATPMVDLLEADTLLNQGYFNAALNKVSTASESMSTLNESDSVSKLSKALGNQTIFTLGYGEYTSTAKIYGEGYTEVYAGQYVSEVVTEKTAKSDLRLFGLRKYIDEYNYLVTTQEKASDLLYEYSNAAAEDVPYDDLIKKLEDLRGTEGIADQYISYYECYVAMIAEKGQDVQISYLLKMEKEYPEGLLVYGPILADCYYLSGNYDKVIEYADRMIAKNRNYSSAYEQKLSALLAKGDTKGAEEVCDALDEAENQAGVASGDYTTYSLRANLYWYTGRYDDAIKVCEDGIAASGGDVDIYRNEAIAYMLKGDYEKASECGKLSYQFAMNYGSLTLDIINTAALAAGLAKDTETYKTLEDYLKNYNMNVSSAVTDCLAGKKTVKDIFITDGGVIS